MVWQVAAQGRADRARVPVDAHVVHELGHVRAVLGEDHSDREAHLVTSMHRLPSTHYMLTGAKGGPNRRGAGSGVRTSTVSCTSQPWNTMWRSGGQSRRAELVAAVCSAPRVAPKEARAVFKASVAILAQTISCSNVRGVSPVHDRLVLSCPSVYNPVL